MRQRIGRRLISIMLSVLMLVSLLPTAVFAEELPDQTTAGVTEQVGEGTVNTVEGLNENKDRTGGEGTTAGGEEAVGTEITLDDFLTRLADNNYNFDGATAEGGKLVVKWSPASGCYDTRTDHTCTVGNVTATGNTPKRVNSALTQFQLFEGENVAVTVKNVKFVYEPADFTVCENSGWKGTFTAKQAPAGQLYFMTTGDVTFDSCEFNKVVLTTFNTTGSTTVKGCSFANVYNNYAIKDIRGANVSVTGTTIENCGGGIMVSSTGAVEKVTITGNTFKNVDVTDTAAEDKVGSRGLIQVASSGNYAGAAYGFSNNTATNCGPVLRQLNESVKLDKTDTGNLEQLGNTLYTSDSKQAATVAGVVYPTLAAAIAAASAGDTVKLLKDVTLTETLTIDKNLTLDVNGTTLTVQTSSDGIVVNNAELTLANSGSTGKYIFDCSARGSDGVYVYNEDANTTSKLIVNSDVEIKVNSNVNSAIHAFGKQGTAVVDISNGKITATGSGKQFHAIHADQNSTINVTGGEFELNVDFESYSEGNDVVGVAIFGNAGKQENIHVNITGGKFTVGGKNAFAQAVQVGMVNGKSEECTVSISGGEVVLNPTENGTGYVYATYNTSYATAEITGGSVSGAITALVNPHIKNDSIPNDGLTVSGGTFDTKVDAKYLAGGVKQDASGNIVEDYVAKIGTVKYKTLDEAIKAVENGGTIVVNAGEYKLNGSLTYTGKAFTIKAADGMDVSFDMSAAVALHGAKITFEGVTFDYKTNGNYIGLQHTDTLVYNKCTIKGMVFLYATNETFNSCTFTQTSADAYNVWTYGAKNVKFNSCTFNCVGKSVLVYHEGTNTKTDLTVKDTEFIASAPVEGKAAIEIDTSLMKDGTTIKVTNTTADGFAEGSNSKSTLWNDKKQTEETNKNTTVTVDGEEVFAPKIAEVGGVVYPSLEAAFAKLNAENHTLKLLNESAWAESTPVYWAAGGQSGYAAKLTDALTAAYKANAGDITIVCRPGADVGTMTHGHVADNITIYGNNAYLSGGECDLEVDTFKFSRTTGKQDTTNGVSLDKNIAITAYELDNLGVWGQRNTSYKVNVNLTDCDGKAIADKENVQRVYISGISGEVNITLKGCDFLTAATAVYSNADGEIAVEDCSFTGGAAPVNINHKAGGAVTVEVKNSTFTGCGDEGSWASFAAPVRFVNSGSGTMDTTVDSCTFTGTVGNNGDILIGDGRTGEKSNNLGLTVKNTKGWVLAQKPGYYDKDGGVDDYDKCVDKLVDASEELTISIKGAFLPDNAGSEKTPYTLEQFSEMTRAEYIEAQERLGDTMYVEVGSYSYTTNGMLGNGVRDDTPGQVPDHSKLNSYAENGYLGEGNDGANGKNIVFVKGTITSGVKGYTSIDNIGTSLLLAVPAYTNVTFEGITFKNVMSFDYQLYTSPWSQLGSLNFEDCTFKGIIVGAIAARSLKFNGCTFEKYTNTIDANNSNPTWIRPAYGNWTKGDNEGQGNDFRSLTEITFTNNTVSSTRPVKFERIAQWEMDTTVTATDNTFTINPQRTDGNKTKNVGMYFGANAKFNLIVDNNTAKGKTAGLYTAVYSAPNGTNYPGLPAGSTVKDANGNNIEKGVPALEWKSTKPLTLKTTEEVAQLTTTKGVVKFATLEKAIAEAKDGDTVTLLKSCSGNGIKIKTENFATKGLTVDFGGCTYAVGGVLVGSAGTGTNAFQLLKGGKVTFRNGTIVGVTEGTKPAKDTPNWHGAPAIVIQNYCDLTLKDMTVSGGDETIYTVSNNHGNVVIEDSIINAGNAKGSGYGPFAFDVCGYSTYDGVSVTVKGNSTINGDIEVSRSANNTNDVNLALESGAINGKLKIDSTIKDITTTTTVTKGSDVTVAAPVGYAWNAEGTLVEAVAQIGENGYVTLAAAIAAAEDGDTVQLLADRTEDVTIRKSITLDLGGKTLTNTDAGKATISVNNGVTATVKNGSVIGGASYYNIEVTKGSNANLTLMGVTATAGNTGSSMIDNWGTLTIVSGTYTGGLNVVKSEEGSTLTINGGKFTLEYATNGYTGVVFAYGDTTISGGEFIQDLPTTGRWNHPTVILTGVVEGYTAITRVTGGHFVNKMSGESIFRGVGKATSDNFEVSGGTFNKSISDGYCADGFIPTKNADGTYGVKAGKYVAKVGSTGYETLADAIKAAKSGKTITLQANVTENVTISAKKKNLTLDLNGYTLNGGTVKGKAALTNYGTITIKDTSAAKTGTIKRDDNGTAGYYVIDNQGTMTIAGGHIYNKTGPMPSGSSLIRNAGVDKAATLKITGGDIKHDGFIAVKNDDHGILNISGGTITTTGDTETHTASAVQNWATATITGGTINGTVWTSVWSNELPASVTTIKNATVTGKIVVKPYSNDLSVKPTLEIKSGTYKVSGWDVQGNGVVAISGGTFTSAVPAKYCAPNYEPVANPDGTYGVTHFDVARIGSEGYETLQEAINAAEDGQKIYLLRDITVTDTVKFDKVGLSIAIDLQGHTITGDKCRALHVIDGTLQINNTTANNGEAVITSTGIATASSVIRVGDGDHRQAQGENMKSPALDIAAGVTVKAVCSYGITVFGYGEEKLTVNGNVISTATTNASYDGCAISTVGDDKTTANVTINGGTITAENTNAIYMPSGNLLVYSGAIVRGLTGIYAKSGNVQIKGAKIYGTGEAKGYSYHGNGGIPTGDALVLDSCGYPNGAPKVNYEGAGDAYFESTNAKPIGSYARDGYTKVTGFVDKGTFNKAIDKDLLAGGYVCVYNAETDNYGVATTENCVAKVGDIYYATLQDAIDAAQNGATVVLVKDVDTPEVTYVIDKSLTIDLNGKTVTGSGYDGVFHITGKDANVVINGTVAGSKVVAKEDKSYAMAVWADAAGCTVTLNGGDYGQIITGTDDQYDMIYTSAGTIIINSGSFESRRSKWTLNCLDAAYKARTANIIVNGGTFKGFDPMNGETEGKGTSFVAAGVGVDYVDGKFTAKSGMTAQVVGADGKSVKAYNKSLSAALAAAKAGQTVKLLNSVNGEKYVEVEANVTLDLNGHDLTGAKLLWVTGTILDSATKKGIVSATKYLLPANNGYAPIYNSTEDGYSFFDLNVFSAKTESGSGVWFRLGKSTERAAAVELMKANDEGRRIKAIVTVSWENGEEGSGKQSFEFADGKMATYLTGITQYAFEVTIGGLNRISGKITAQAQFVVYDAEGGAIYTIAGDNWTIQE